jgi:hypothetical protein
MLEHAPNLNYTRGDRVYFKLVTRCALAYNEHHVSRSKPSSVYINAKDKHEPCTNP